MRLISVYEVSGSRGGILEGQGMGNSVDPLQEGVDAMDQWLHVQPQSLLVDLYGVDRQYLSVPYELLRERAPHESISHKAMPTFDEHVAFVESRPYAAWYLVCDRSHYAGAVFLGKDRTIGVGILQAHRRQGLGRRAVQELMRLHPGSFRAIIAPGNVKSSEMFVALGFRRTHCVYEAP